MVFLVKQCIKCGAETIHPCCQECVKKCTHDWKEVHTTPNLAMAIQCQKCHHIDVVQLKKKGKKKKR